MVSECPHALFILTGAIKNLFWNKSKRMEDNSNVFPLLIFYFNIGNIAESPWSLYVLTCILSDYLCQAILIEG